MSTISDTTSNERFGTRRFILVWVAVSAVAWLAHFSLSARMGLYEDDHWLIGAPMCEWKSVADLGHAVERVVVTYTLGRPLQLSLGFVLTYVATHTGGLTAAYALAATVWSLNVGLCLYLLWRPFGATAATAAALLFVLMPADTTQALLHGVFYVHTAVTFLLLSGVAYARGRWSMSALLAGLTLLTYEVCFLPALVWPLLFPASGRSAWRRCLTHWVVMGALLVTALSVRVAVGEDRVSGAMTDKRAMPMKVARLVTIGPRAALVTFVTRPLATVRAWRSASEFTGHGPRRRTVVGLAVVTGLFALTAVAAARRSEAADELAGSAIPTHLARLIAAGAVMAVLGYVASVTREPNVVSGRMSSVHIGPTVGWALAFGGVVAAVGRLLARIRAGWALPPLLAAYVTLLAGFHVFVQREYIRAWIAQGEFWQDVAAECPDVRSGTIILYPLVKPVSVMIHHQEWADHMIFQHLFALPADWTAAPMTIPVGHTTWGVPRDYVGYDWNEVEKEGDRLYWKHWDGVRVRLEPGNVILMKQTPDGRFVRLFGTVWMAGVELPLKPREGAAFAFVPNTLYPAMFPNGLQANTRRRALR